MSSFDFVNHETFPEDPYIAEACTICLEGKYRIVYLRKKTQTGGLFWDEISASVKQSGDKKYLKSFSSDSNFLREDILAFLNARSWEKGQSAPKNDGMPF